MGCHLGAWDCTPRDLNQTFTLPGHPSPPLPCHKGSTVNREISGQPPLKYRLTLAFGFFLTDLSSLLPCP